MINTNESITNKEPARVCCNNKIDNYNRCGNDEFIIHSKYSIQCSKCGKRYDGLEEVGKYYFVKEYNLEKQEPILKEAIKNKSAKLIATLYPNHFLECKELSILSGKTKKSILGSPVEVPNSWVDIYLTGTGAPLVAYYFSLNNTPSMWDYVLTTTGDILLISEELPKFDPLQGAGSKAYVPVQNPDKLVFTGATVGGITTGGFHTQSGGISYETISLGYHQHVRFKAGKFGEKPIDFSFLPLRLDIYSSNKLPERFKNKASNQGRDYYVDSIPDRIKKENRDYSEALFFDYVQIEDEEFNELIFGAQSDEQLYNKAIQLASKGSKEALTEAAKMFAQLGDYKDSLFKSNDCLQKASHAINESGCYVATAVYGSYDCPQVWTLRRYRDYTLAETWYGRAFVRTYYAISPTLVKWFGETQWFKNMWKPKLDRMVKKLNEKGVADTPYQDRNW